MAKLNDIFIQQNMHR